MADGIFLLVSFVHEAWCLLYKAQPLQSLVNNCCFCCSSELGTFLRLLLPAESTGRCWGHRNCICQREYSVLFTDTCVLIYWNNVCLCSMWCEELCPLWIDSGVLVNKETCKVNCKRKRKILMLWLTFLLRVFLAIWYQLKAIYPSPSPAFRLFHENFSEEQIGKYSTYIGTNQLPVIWETA